IGIIGIVASKLVEKFNVPVFLMTSDDKNVYRCSIRGIEAVDIAKTLQSLADILLGFGGHSMAGGFSSDMEKVPFEMLKKRITEAVINYRDDSKVQNLINIDLELTGGDISVDLIKQL